MRIGDIDVAVIRRGEGLMLRCHNCGDRVDHVIGTHKRPLHHLVAMNYRPQQGRS